MSGIEVNMIGKVAPIMTYEMLMRKFVDGWDDKIESNKPGFHKVGNTG
jgi:hypothetical protein